MSDLSGLAVALGQPCPNCRGADTARVEVVRETCRLRCHSCHADRGELPEATIKFLRDTVRAFGTPLKPVFLTSAMQGPQMKREDLFPSKYIKAADLGGKPLDVVIKSAGVETLKDMQGSNTDKLVLGFINQPKLLVVNKTNYEAIAELHGEETDNWPGKRIQLYPDKASLGGKSVAAVRVRAPLGDALNESIDI
jgi:hypothetical protein